MEAEDEEECAGVEKCKREPQSGREGNNKDGKDVVCEGPSEWRFAPK